MNMAKNKIFWYVALLLAGALIISGSIAVWMVYGKGPTTHTIVMGPESFSPAFLIIEVGDSVTFRSDNGAPFWPASNEHPSHLAYPDFDPKMPIAPDEEWTYTFTQEGTYGFHDHILPHYKGEIRVVANGTVTEQTEPVSFDQCLHMSPINLKVACWAAFLDHKMQTEGVIKAFEVFTEVYNADPEFVAMGCHGAVHLMGEGAYDLYKKGGKVDFTSNTTVCGYGFYHGFLGRLLRDRPDLDEAVLFCDALRDSYEPSQGDSIYRTCFHGIGHGMVEETPLPEYYWGKAEALIDPALKACSLLPEAYQHRECADGAFNGLTRFMVNDLFGFTYNTEDPLGWCERFKDNRINYVSCNFELSQHFATQDEIMHNRNMADILPFLEGLDREVQVIVVETAVGGLIQSDVIREDNSDYFRKCEVFTEEALHYACIRGLVTGFFNFGEPGNEAPKARAFCASEEATDWQRSVCEEALASYVGQG